MIEEAENLLTLTACQKKGLEALRRADRNVFLTGAPGTGKSFLIRRYLEEKGGNIPVIASTGAAAILIGGRTFHSFFGLGIMQGGPSQVIEKAHRNSRLKSRLKKTKTLIIDEISMLSKETLDCAERVAREIRRSDEPWGGIRIIAVGDFAQLPPISRGREKEWAFEGTAWKRSDFDPVILREVKRSEDVSFVSLLEEIRWGRVGPDVEAYLNSRLACDEEMERDVPHLFPRRAEVEAYNRMRLENLSDAPRLFETEYGGESRFIERLKQDAPVPPVLEIKKGALVMFRVNDPKQRYINGTVGTVVDITGDTLWVESGGREIEVTPFVFTLQNDEGEEAAYAINFPLHLAYASTIHKIQGTTLERAHISLRNLWEPGQAYVALSRARTASSVTLMGWDRHSIRSDDRVREFYFSLGFGQAGA